MPFLKGEAGASSGDCLPLILNPGISAFTAKMNTGAIFHRKFEPRDSHFLWRELPYKRIR